MRNLLIKFNGYIRRNLSDYMDGFKNKSIPSCIVMVFATAFALFYFVMFSIIIPVYFYQNPIVFLVFLVVVTLIKLADNHESLIREQWGKLGPLQKRALILILLGSFAFLVDSSGNEFFHSVYVWIFRGIGVYLSVPAVKVFIKIVDFIATVITETLLAFIYFVFK